VMYRVALTFRGPCADQRMGTTPHEPAASTSRGRPDFCCSRPGEVV